MVPYNTIHTKHEDPILSQSPEEISLLEVIWQCVSIHTARQLSTVPRFSPNILMPHNQ